MLEKMAQSTITKIGVPTVLPQGNRVSQLAKKTEIQRVAAIKSGSWAKVMTENREKSVNQADNFSYSPKKVKTNAIIDFNSSFFK